MARASRQVFEVLDTYAKQSDVRGLTIPAHVYLCDVLTLKYYQNSVINIIKSKMGAIPKSKRNSQHFTVSYWYPIVDNMFKNQDAPKRDIYNTIYGEMSDYNSFNHIVTKFMITDYSTNDAHIINMLVNTYDIKDIISACNVAIQHKADGIAYVKAVLEREKAKHDVQIEKMDALNNRTQSSNRLLDRDIHKHTPIELAQMQYNYTKKQEDAILQALVDKLLGGKSSADHK